MINFAKKFVKLPDYNFNAFARGECGSYPLNIDYFCRCVKYWVKLTRMNSNRLPHNCYKMLRNLDENGRITWATKMRALLFKYGFGYVWLSEDVGDLNLFMTTFKRRQDLFLDGDIPCSTSYRVYISQLNRFTRVSSHVADFNARNNSLTAKLLQQGYRYHKLRKTFSKFHIQCWIKKTFALRPVGTGILWWLSI